MLSFKLLGLDLSDENSLFALFGLIILVFLLLDLGVFNKTAHKISTKSALYQSIFWVFISTVFGYLIYNRKDFYLRTLSRTAKTVVRIMLLAFLTNLVVFNLVWAYSALEIDTSVNMEIH